MLLQEAPAYAIAFTLLLSFISTSQSIRFLLSFTSQAIVLYFASYCPFDLVTLGAFDNKLGSSPPNIVLAPFQPISISVN